jgi:hypothetical protein
MMGRQMVARSRLPYITALGAALLVVAGCAAVSPVGSYPNPDGPRNGTGFLVDPKTGVTLPGQPEAGGHR